MSVARGIYDKMGRGVRVVLSLSALGLAACPARAPDERCAWVKVAGMCEVDVSLEPREPDSPDESTMMEVRWTWVGGDDAPEVLPRVVRYHMTAQEAAWRKASWESLERSRCIVEEPVAPCEAPRRIVFVEAEP